MVTSFPKRLLAVPFRGTYPARGQGADNERRKIRRVRCVDGEGTKRRNKKVVHGQGGKKDGEQAGRRAAKPRAGHHRCKEQEQEGIGKQVLEKQTRGKRRRYAHQSNAKPKARE